MGGRREGQNLVSASVSLCYEVITALHSKQSVKTIFCGLFFRFSPIELAMGVSGNRKRPSV